MIGGRESEFPRRQPPEKTVMWRSSSRSQGWWHKLTASARRPGGRWAAQRPHGRRSPPELQQTQRSDVSRAGPPCGTRSHSVPPPLATKGTRRSPVTATCPGPNWQRGRESCSDPSGGSLGPGCRGEQAKGGNRRAPRWLSPGAAADPCQSSPEAALMMPVPVKSLFRD